MDMHIHSSDITPLWHKSYYDGMLSGIVKISGRKYFVEMIDESRDPDENDWYRKYAVYEMTDKQIEIEEENHELFREHVGTHCDYQIDKSEKKDEKNWEEFYDADKRTYGVEKSQKVGWCYGKDIFGDGEE